MDTADDRAPRRGQRPTAMASSTPTRPCSRGRRPRLRRGHGRGSRTPAAHRGRRRVSVDGGFQSDVTEADGSYRLTLPIGSVTINAAAFGYGDYSVTVEVVEDLTTNQDLAPRRPALGHGHGHGLQRRLGARQRHAGRRGGRRGRRHAPGVGDHRRRRRVQLPAARGYGLRVPRLRERCWRHQPAAPVDADTHLELYLSALTQDGFETGNFNALSWLTNGDANWYVQGAEVHSGAYAARRATSATRTTPTCR